MFIQYNWTISLKSFSCCCHVHSIDRWSSTTHRYRSRFYHRIWFGKSSDSKFRAIQMKWTTSNNEIAFKFSVPHYITVTNQCKRSCSCEHAFTQYISSTNKHYNLVCVCACVCVTSWEKNCTVKLWWTIIREHRTE